MNNHTKAPLEEDTKPRERAYIVKWMKEVIAGKPTIQERKAFLAKMNSICTYHNITLEELVGQEK